jgi:hypothetical protein
MRLIGGVPSLWTIRKTPNTEKSIENIKEKNIVPEQSERSFFSSAR